MFTGIIQQVGRIKIIEDNRFEISHNYSETFEIGESIALNGMCATVVEIYNSSFAVEIMKESRDRTVFGSAQEGDLVNLERSAKIGQRNSGHHVTGHIDQVGTILKLEKKDDFWLFRISIDPENALFIVQKGSVAVDGISLTISDLANRGSKNPEPKLGKYWFEVSIISHTWEQTNLHTKKEGDPVNLEFDILGKYAINYQSTMNNE